MVLPQPVVVDQVSRPVRGVAIVDMAVEAAHGERRAKAVAFAGMVEDQVENGADACGMKGCNGFAQFGHAARHQARIERHEGDGVIAPAIGQLERRQMALVDPGRDRHQLDGRDADPLQMADDGGMGKRCDGAALMFRHVRMQHGEGAHGNFVDQAAGFQTPALAAARSVARSRLPSAPDRRCRRRRPTGGDRNGRAGRVRGHRDRPEAWRDRTRGHYPGRSFLMRENRSGFRRGASARVRLYRSSSPRCIGSRRSSRSPVSS